MSDLGVDRCLSRIVSVYFNHFKQSGLDADMALQVYHEILDDVDDHLLMAATKQWLSTARPFPPSPGELRDMALSLVERSNGEKSAEEAWLEVAEAIHKIGSYGVPTWSNELIERTVKAFGWKDLCLIETDKMSYTRDQFIRIYKSQVTRRHEDRLMLPETREIVDRYQMTNGNHPALRERNE